MLKMSASRVTNCTWLCSGERGAEPLAEMLKLGSELLFLISVQISENLVHGSVKGRLPCLFIFIYWVECLLWWIETGMNSRLVYLFQWRNFYPVAFIICESTNALCSSTEYFCNGDESWAKLWFVFLFQEYSQDFFKYLLLKPVRKLV